MRLPWRWLGVVVLLVGCSTPYHTVKNAHEVVWFCIPYCGSTTASSERYCWNAGRQKIIDQTDRLSGCARVCQP